MDHSGIEMQSPIAKKSLNWCDKDSLNDNDNYDINPEDVIVDNIMRNEESNSSEDRVNLQDDGVLFEDSMSDEENDDTLDVISLTDEELDEKDIDKNIMQDHIELEQTTLPLENVPNVPSEYTPYGGMEFDSDDAAYEFYNTYARIAGFDAVKSSSKIRRGEIYYKIFVCTKEGKKRKIEESKKCYVSQKCNCNAKMTISKCHQTRKWIVNTVHYGHNHVLHTPSKLNMYRSNRKLNDGQKNALNAMLSGGLKASQAMKLLAQEAGGRQNVPFKVQQIYAQKKKHANTYKGMDCQLMLKYFVQKKEENPSFYFAIQIEQNEIGNIFWIDARCREDYQYFGDVISFDTTYKANKYLMPFASFTGINHHRQSINFGCALLVNEKKDSFIWIFKEWLNAMNNCHPPCIITDQDLAMRAAIKEVFPNSVYKFCRWHIMQKVPKNLKALYKRNSKFKLLWDKWFYDTKTVSDFEASWDLLVATFPALLKSRFATDLWEDRKMWSKVYGPYVFTAGIFTTQRSESMNSYYKKELDQNTPLHIFVKKFEQALEARRLVEKESDKDMVDRCLPSLTGIQMEEHLRDTFTPSIFKEVRSQYIMSLSCFLHLESDDNVKTYSGRRMMSNDKDEEFTIFYDKSTKEIGGCACGLWEYSGIICCHMFSIMQREEMHEVPHKYILLRWTKKAKNNSRLSSSEVTMTAYDSFLLKSHLLHLKLNKIASEAKKCLETLDDTLAWGDQWFDQVEKRNFEVREKSEAPFVKKANNDKQEDVDVLRSTDTHVRNVVIEDRSPVQAKGNSKRLISAFEKGVKAKVCHSCGKTGHDSRTCKLSITLSNIGEASSKIVRKCHHCYGEGHDKRNCPKLKKKVEKCFLKLHD